jgi:predicted Rossmann fold nucleotide-binding protein DprA/Smf involved in DNA uptake
VVELFGRERELFELISPEPVHFDLLCERSGIPAPELSATLTMLELAGVVTRHPGDWYSRAHANVTK